MQSSTSKWILIACIVAILSVVTSKLYSPDTPVSINETMSDIGNTLGHLAPLVFHDKEGENQQELLEISTDIETLVKLFEQAKPHFRMRSTAYQISFDVIETHLKSTYINLKNGYYNTTKPMLRELFSICASCHTQDKETRHLFGGTTREKFSSDLHYAEFAYATRDYDVALTYLAKSLNDKTVKLTEPQLLQAFKRALTIFAQIKNQPAGGAVWLKTYSQYPGHTQFSKTTLSEWVTSLDSLSKADYQVDSPPEFAQIKQLVTQILGDPDAPVNSIFPSKQEKVTRLWLRGLLYTYLNSNPKEEEIPQLLYWLAICDRSINYSFYFSLADLYLKECIVRYHQHPVAKSCFNEYREYITFSYSGSAGTNIPQEIRDELYRLEQMLQ